jgi:hypothetical protein
MTYLKPVDLTFSVHPVALAVAHLVNTWEVSEETAAKMRTSAWYNGRERGICVEIEGLFVVWGECRASTKIFVDTWVQEPRSGFGMNPPTWCDQPKASYEERKYFGPGQLRKAARHIAVLLGLDDGEE